MKSSVFLLLPVISCIAHADTIRMRNGTEHEGEVVAEKDDHYVVKIQVTKTIRDERKIPKSEILEIVAERKDMAAFESLKGLVPTPDLLTLEQYDSLTESVEGFMATHPKSDLLGDADKLLKVLDGEREIVAAGGLKFEGKMVQPDDRAAHAYPLDARIAASKVTTNGDAGDITSALRAWSELDKKFSTSQAYRDTLPYVRKMMTSHIKNIDKGLASMEARIKEREEGLARIDQRDRARTKRAIDEQAAAYAAKLAAEKEAKVRWPSLDPFHKEPLMQTKRNLEQDLSKLDRFDASKVPDGDKLWNDAWEVLTGTTDRQEASAAISAARSGRLPAEYIEILEAKAPAK